MCVTMNPVNNFSTGNTSTVNRNQPINTENNIQTTNNPPSNNNRNPAAPLNPNGSNTATIPNSSELRGDTQAINNGQVNNSRLNALGGENNNERTGHSRVSGVNSTETGSSTTVTFTNNNRNFQDLVNQARELSRDGSLNESDLDTLRQSASTNGLSRDEQNFLLALRNEENVRLLQSPGFNPQHFTMEVISRLPATSAPTNNSANNNPLGNQASQVDPASQVMNNPNDQNLTPQQIREQINSIFANQLHTPTLPVGVQRLTENFNNDREVLLYVRELARRGAGTSQPPLSVDTINNICSQVDSMSRTAHHPSAGPSRNLAVSALHDVAIPSDIDQARVGSCAGTSIQTQMALRDPQQYLTMVDTLARNQNYQTESGQTIQPNLSFTHDHSRRNISSRIMQNAIMDDANGNDRYNSRRDPDEGLTDPQTARTMNNLFPGQNYTGLSTPSYTRSELISILNNSNPSRTNPVVIALIYGAPNERDAYHAVNAIGTSEQGVTVINPWGREELITWAQLNQRMDGIVTNTNPSTGVSPSSRR